MSPVFNLSIVTQGGVADLSRVVGVLALYDLTPARLALSGHGAGLSIEIRLQTDDRLGQLCASRIASLPAVVGVSLRARQPRERAA